MDPLISGLCSSFHKEDEIENLPDDDGFELLQPTLYYQ